MITLTIGQLFPQLIADEYTVRFLNLRGSLLFVNIAAAFESIGIFTHCSWIASYIYVHFLFRWKEKPECGTNNPIDSLDISRSTHALIGNLRDRDSSSSSSTTTHSMVEMRSAVLSTLSGEDVTWQRVEELNPMKSGCGTSLLTLIKLGLSSGLTAVAAAVILYGIFYASPMMKLHPALLLLVLVFCMMMEFYLEGTQVAILAVQGRDRSSIPVHLTNTLRVLDIAAADRHVVKKFLIGRQFLVVMSMFTMASITTYQHYHDYPQRLFPQKLFGTLILTGFSGVLFALNTVQLPAQIIAQQYPTLFLNFPGSVLLVQAALLIENSGMMHFGWILFHIIGKLAYHTG